MASTTLTEAIVPEVFTDYVIARTRELSAWFTSGLVGVAGEAGMFLDGGGQKIQMPRWNEDKTDANLSDDGGPVAPVAITSFQEDAFRNLWNQHWGTKDVVRSLAGSDPLRAVGDTVSRYWAREFDKWLASAFEGIYADNLADENDMIHNASGLMTVADIEDAKATAGENGFDMFNIIVMHSQQYNNLVKDQLVTELRDMDANTSFASIAGLRIVISDRCPTVLTTKKLAILAASGSVMHDESTAGVVTAETDRLPLEGTGGGEEILSSRRQFLFHPAGTTMLDAGVGGPAGPTLAELKLAAAWDRTTPERAQVPFAFLTSGP